jgi:hypothetical protein
MANDRGVFQPHCLRHEADVPDQFGQENTGDEHVFGDDDA